MFLRARQVCRSSLCFLPIIRREFYSTAPKRCNDERPLSVPRAVERFAFDSTDLNTFATGRGTEDTGQRCLTLFTSTSGHKISVRPLFLYQSQIPMSVV